MQTQLQIQMQQDHNGNPNILHPALLEHARWWSLSRQPPICVVQSGAQSHRRLRTGRRGWSGGQATAREGGHHQISMAASRLIRWVFLKGGPRPPKIWLLPLRGCLACHKAFFFNQKTGVIPKSEHSLCSPLLGFQFLQESMILDTKD